MLLEFKLLRTIVSIPHIRFINRSAHCILSFLSLSFSLSLSFRAFRIATSPLDQQKLHPT